MSTLFDSGTALTREALSRVVSTSHQLFLFLLLLHRATSAEHGSPPCFVERSVADGAAGMESLVSSTVAEAIRRAICREKLEGHPRSDVKGLDNEDLGVKEEVLWRERCLARIFHYNSIWVKLAVAVDQCLSELGF